MFNQKINSIFVLSTALLGGLGAFFIYDVIFDNLDLSIVIGVAVAIFIAGMEVLFVINMLDIMRYEFLRVHGIQFFEKRRKSWLKSLLETLRPRFK